MTYRLLVRAHQQGGMATCYLYGQTWTPHGTLGAAARLPENQAVWLGPRPARLWECRVESVDEQGQIRRAWVYNGQTGEVTEVAAVR
jgi:hypothetical protein